MKLSQGRLTLEVLLGDLLVWLKMVWQRWILLVWILFRIGIVVPGLDRHAFFLPQLQVALHIMGCGSEEANNYASEYCSEVRACIEVVTHV